jgi:hypothetical protein
VVGEWAVMYLSLKLPFLLSFVCSLSRAACDDDTKSEIVVPVFGSNFHNEKDVKGDGKPKKVIDSLFIFVRPHLTSPAGAWLAG